MNQTSADPANDPSPASPRASTIVVGAGLGGLLAALAAADAVGGSQVIVLDPRPPGGRARCDGRAGFSLNRGPRALYVRGAADRALRAAGVDTSHGAKPALAGGGALRDGALHDFPSGPLAATRTTLLSAREKASLTRALASLWRHADAERGDQTLAEWLDRHVAAPPVRQFLEALVRVSTYANAPERIAVGPALAQAWGATTTGVRYLDGGWQSLVDQLVAIARDRGVEILPVGARTVVSGADGSVTVHATDDRLWHASAAVLAPGGPDAVAAMLGGVPASWPALGPSSTVACLELGVRRLPERRFVLGIDEPVYASVHAPPARLAPEGHGVIHLMRYQPDGDTMEAAHQQAQLEALARQIGVATDDIVTQRFLARMVVTHALPIASAGGVAGRVPVAVADHPGVFLVGDWVGRTGLLLDAVAASATEAGRLAATRSATMVPA